MKNRLTGLLYVAFVLIVFWLPFLEGLVEATTSISREYRSWFGSLKWCFVLFLTGKDTKHVYVTDKRLVVNWCVYVLIIMTIFYVI